MASEKLFNDFIDDSFPAGSKRTRSGLFHQDYADRIVRLLKAESVNKDKNFRHLVKRNGFQLVDVPEAGLRDVLVVKISDAKEVSIGVDV